MVLFEVIGNFGDGLIDPDKCFLEVAIPQTSALDLPPGSELRFVLTSPQELKAMSLKNWPALRRLKTWMAKSPVTVHHADSTGRALKPLLGFS